MSLFVSLFFPRLSFSVFTVSVSIFVSLFLPPFFSIIMLCFSLYFYPLLLVLNIHLFSVHRFFLSFAFLCFSFFSSLLPSTFSSLCLVHAFFLACFYSLLSFVSLKLYVSPLSFVLFSSHHSVFPSLVSFFSPFHIFSRNFSPLMIRKTPKLTPCTRYDVTSAYLLCKSGVN